MTQLFMIINIKHNDYITQTKDLKLLMKSERQKKKKSTTDVIKQKIGRILVKQ